ncbi:polysaccharide pyruvyl transferase family protein [Mesobacillus maritimus]|uniref:polysaccharide pyruvyl transferase family protein n=1 Tax=Mesobacillus maritimus TaxID=1643336 RepID=UPI00203D39FD|nr:polysaccharide pyruvyl transferase family protein [Mesobacillus maritimus]MCM3586979.1 polysaccharide pyruvyl transferase family protein [Mesobacillus maritimus]
MRKITIFNTWVTSENTGDRIIMDACQEIIHEVFNDSIYVEVPTHTKMSMHSHNLMQESSLGIVCGTNLLKPNMLIRRLWKIGLLDTLFIKDAVLLGVGWQSYSKVTSLFSRVLWRRVLSEKYIHAVRDEYTKEKLLEIGIKNVVNTACPTMWKLTKDHCKNIPQNKAEDVVVTLTDYNKNLSADNLMLDILSKNYKRVYLWPQSYGDILYLDELNLPENLQVISPNLESFNKILEKDVDFVGTRLHAGIRAMQKMKRTIIIGIDNRAIEKEKFGLKVLKREDINRLHEVINQSFETEIFLPFDEIDKWKSQFKTTLKNNEKHLLFRVKDSIKGFLKGIIGSAKAEKVGK